MMRWYVMTVKDKEQAIANLACQGFEVYMPMMEIRENGKISIRSMFGHYGFVRFDKDEDQWKAICSTRGVRRIIAMNPEEPCPVPVGFVEQIRENQMAGNLIISDEIAVGDRVKVIEGPLAGYEGICSFSSSKRCEVLLTLLGRENNVIMNPINIRRTIL